MGIYEIRRDFAVLQERGSLQSILPYPITASTNKDLVPGFVILIMSTPALSSKGWIGRGGGEMQKPVADTPRSIHSWCCSPCVSSHVNRPSRPKSASPLPPTELLSRHPAS